MDGQVRLEKRCIPTRYSSCLHGTMTPFGIVGARGDGCILKGPLLDLEEQVAQVMIILKATD